MSSELSNELSKALPEQVLRTPGAFDAQRHLQSVFPPHISSKDLKSVVWQYPQISDQLPSIEELNSVIIPELLVIASKSLDTDTRDRQLRLLQNLESFGIKIHCVKEVISVHEGISTDAISGKLRKVAAFGVNGLNPALLGPEQYPVAYLVDQVISIAALQNITLTEAQVNATIAQILMQKDTKTHLSCPELTRVLEIHGVAVDGKMYCMKNQNVSGGRRQPNTACPSHLYCAEGSAQLGLRYAALLAHLFDLDALTVIRVARAGDKYVVVHASPVTADNCKQGAPIWQIWLPRLHIDQDKTDFLLGMRLPLPDKAIESNQNINIKDLQGADWNVSEELDYKKAFKGLTAGQFQPFQQIEPAKIKITNHVWTANVCPCPICAVKGKDRVATPGFNRIEVDDVSAIYFTRFSQEKYKEGMDEGDIIPLLIIYAKLGIVPRRLLDWLQLPSMRKK